MTRKRRSSLAYTAAERDGFVRWGYLAQYEADPEFGRDLLALYADHASRLGVLPDEPLVWWLGARSDREDVRQFSGVNGPISAYVAAVDALCRRYGLHRLQLPLDRPGELDVGAALVHEWCRWRGVCAERGREHGPEQFSQGYDVRGAVPDLSEGPWDARRETYGAAAARLGWRRAGDLRTIAEQAEAGGLLFLDTRPELQRDLGWLYRHVARDESYASIVAVDLGDDPDLTKEETVRRAVERMARRVLHPISPAGR